MIGWIGDALGKRVAGALPNGRNSKTSEKYAREDSSAAEKAIPLTIPDRRVPRLLSYA
jgi:hypothetical protein